MSGSTIGGFAGALVGAYFGNPQLGFMIGSALGGYVDPEKIQGPRLTDAAQQTSQDGIPIPFGYGTFPTAGNVIWQGRLIERKKKERAKGGPEVTNYTYTRSYAIGICEGPIAGLLMIKRNGKVVYDARTEEEIEFDLRDIDWEGDGSYSDFFTAPFRYIQAFNSKFINKATIYLGDETQLPDSVIEAVEGVGNVAPNRGLAYIVVEDDDLTDLGGAIPQYEFVVTMGGTVTAGSDAQVVFAAGGNGGLLETSPSITGWAGDTVSSGITDETAPTVWSKNGLLFHFAEGIGRVSADNGATFETVTGLPADTWVNSLVYCSANAKWFAFVQSGESCYSSSNGRNFSAVPMNGGRSRYGSASSGMTIVVGTTNGNVEVTNDGGGTWEIVPTSTGGPIERVVRTGSYFVAFSGGPDQDISYSPDASLGSWVSVSYPGQGGSVFIRGADHNGLSRTVAALSNGDTIFSASGSEWSAGGSTDTIGGGVNCLQWAGTVFLATTASTDGIVSSANGLSWTKVYDRSLGNSMRSIAVAACEGTAVPDAPGVFIHADGELCGGSTETIARDRVVLGTILADIWGRAGIQPDEMDVSAATQLVDGYRVAVESGADGLTVPLMGAYFGDVAEWDGKLRWVPRGGDAVLSLGPDDLAERDGDAIANERVQEAELLRKQTVAYLDPLSQYTRVTQAAERRISTIQARGESLIEMPVVGSSDFAAQVADKRIRVAWSETDKAMFSLPYRLSALTPTDVIELTDKAGKTRRVRLMDVQEDGGVIEIEAPTDRQGTYTSNVTGQTPTPPPFTTPGLIGPTAFVPMNLPQLRTADSVPGIYVAVSGILGGWRGCDLQMSVDGGVSYASVAIIAAEAAMGRLTATALAGDTSLSVEMVNGTFETVTEAQLAAGLNRIALASSDNPEVARFLTATPEVSTALPLYTLSGVDRGLLATTATGHASQSWVVLLDEDVIFVPLDASLSGQTLLFKPVSIGTSLDSTTAYPFVFDYTAPPIPTIYTRVTATGDIRVDADGNMRITN